MEISSSTINRHSVRNHLHPSFLCKCVNKKKHIYKIIIVPAVLYVCDI